MIQSNYGMFLSRENGTIRIFEHKKAGKGGIKILTFSYRA